MHRCLAIPEIILLISDQVRPRSTLAAFSSTCHAFHAVADRLWRTQAYFEPLLKCLPRDAVMVQNKKDDQHAKASLLRPLTPADWLTFTRYASVMWRLILRKIEFDPALLEAIDERRKTHGPLFPKVEHILCDWDEGTRADTETLPMYSRFLIGPLVHKYTMSPSEDHYLGEITTALKASRASLQTLHLDVTEATVPVVASVQISELLAVCENLKILTLPDQVISHTLLKSVAEMPNLVELRVKRRPLNTLSIFKEPFSQTTAMMPIFPALKFLGIEHARLSETCDLLHSVGTVAIALQRFKLSLNELRQVPEQPDIDDFFQRLPITTPTLQSLTFTHTYSVSGSLHTHLIGEGLYPLLPLISLTPLFALGANFRDIHIDIGYPVDLDNGVLLAIAQAWPNLETFSIPSSTLTEDMLPVCTLSGLAAFAKPLVHLHEVEIAVNTLHRDWDLPETEAGEQPPTDPLRPRRRRTTMVGLLDSPIDDVDYIVAFLKDTFYKSYYQPAVSAPPYRPPFSDTEIVYRKKWEEVEEIMWKSLE